MASIDCFLDPKTVQDMVSNYAHKQHQLKMNIVGAIFVAMASGLHAATQSLTGQTGADVLYCLKCLRDIGYGASIVGSTLTISW